jgi:hypothetical protein
MEVSYNDARQARRNPGFFIGAQEMPIREVLLLFFFLDSQV